MAQRRYSQAETHNFAQNPKVAEEVIEQLVEELYEAEFQIECLEREIEMMHEDSFN